MWPRLLAMHWRLVFLCNVLGLMVGAWLQTPFSWRALVAGELALVLLVVSWSRGQRSNALDPPHANTGPGAPLESFSLDPQNIAGIRYGGCPAAPVPTGGLSLNTSWCCIPHPQKAHRGGEDAVFATPFVVGCADGVGGWAARGIDSGLYARGLMDGCKACLKEVKQLARQLAPTAAGGGAAAKAALGGLLNPVRILQHGYDAVQGQHIIGSTTACVVSCMPWAQEGSRGYQSDEGSGASSSQNNPVRGTLQVANLGDSGMMLLRDGAVIVRTVEQTHAFNFPRQLGTGSQDTPADADRISLVALPGDLLIMGTDGLFDNMYDEEITALILEHTNDPKSVGRCFPPKGTAEGNCNGFAGVALKLSIAAYARARDRSRVSPFVRRGVAAGCLDGAKVAAGAHCGGKLDDITTVVCRLESASREPETPSSTPTPKGGFL